MLSILFNWLYIGVTVFCLGSGFSALSGILFGYKLKRMDSVLMAGIIIATIYAQIFSLFAGVGITANLVLIVGCPLTYRFLSGIRSSPRIKSACPTASV